MAERFVSDIFTEVDEEVRREQLKKLWERYGNYIVAAALLVIAAVAAWRGYDYWQTRRAAEEAFAKVVTDGTAGYRVLARLREAAEISERDPKAGVAAYDSIAGETTGQPLISELAAVRAAFLLVDTARLDEMAQRLELLAQPLGAFRHTARELLALAAWRNGDTAATRRWTDAAKNDPEAPSGLRSRMDVLASLLPEAGKP